MKNQLVPYKLTEGFEASEMQYNVVATRSKKTLKFLIVAIIVCAIAFSACFFALEISRVNKYNSRLNNSISSSQNSNNLNEIQSQNPSIGTGSNSSSNQNGSSGSGSSSNQTGAYVKPGDYDVLVQTVWGLADGSYNLYSGLNHAYGAAGYISLRYWGEDDHETADANQISLWQGSLAENSNGGINTPTYSPGTMSEEDYDTFGKNNAMAFNSGIMSAAGDYYEIQMAVGTKSNSNYSMKDFGSFYLTFVQQNTDGSWTLLTEKRCFDEKGATLSIKISSKLGGVKIYAVCTKQVDINVKGLEVEYSAIKKEGAVNTTTHIVNYYRTVSEKTGTTSSFSLNLLNCVGSLTGFLDFIGVWIDGVKFDIVYGVEMVYYSEPQSYKVLSTTFKWNKYKTLKYWKIVNENYYVDAPSVYDVLENYFPIFSPSLMNCVDNGTIYVKDSVFATVSRTGTRDYKCFRETHIQEFFQSGSTADHHIYVNGSNTVTFDYSLGFTVNITGGSSSNFVFKKDITNLNVNSAINKLTVDANFTSISIKKSVKEIYVDGKGSASTFTQDSSTTIDYLTLKNISVVNLKGTVTGETYRTELADCKTVNLNATFNTDFVLFTSGTANFKSGTYQNIHLTGTATAVLSAGVKVLGDGVVYHSSKFVLQGNLLNSAGTTLEEFKITKPDSQFDGIVAETNSAITTKVHVNITGTLRIGTYNVVKTNSTNYSNIIVDVSQSASHEYPKSSNGYIYKISITAYEITTYSGDKADGSNNDGTFSIQWMVSRCVNTNSANYSAADTYILKKDITIPSGFASIQEFTGTFDGNGFMLTFEAGSKPLFSTIVNSTIKNLIIGGNLTTPGGIGSDDNGKEVGFYYGLAFSNWGATQIINVHNMATYGKASDIGPACGMIYINYGTLQFINCAVSNSPVKYTGKETYKHERSSYLGINYKWQDSSNPGQVYFYNCYGKDGTETSDQQLYQTSELYKRSGVFVALSWVASSNGFSSTTAISSGKRINENGVEVSSGNPVGKASVSKGSTGERIYIESCYVGGGAWGDLGNTYFYEGVVGTTYGYANNTFYVNHTGSGIGEMSQGYFALNSAVEFGGIVSSLTDWVNDKNIDKKVTVTNYGYLQKTHELKDWQNGYMLIYEISSGEQLIEIREGTSTMAYRTAKLLFDITVENSWSGFEEFGGYFDGRGYTIKFKNATQGFAKINNGTIERLKIDGTINGSSNYVGGIAGINNGTIKYCNNNASITNTSYHYTGGITGLNNGDVTDCENYGAIKGYDYVGGVIGQNGDSAQEQINKESNSLTNYGNVTGQSYVGGVIGISYRTGEGSNGYFSAKEYTDSWQTKNNPTITGYRYVGGIVGCLPNNSALNSYDETCECTIKINSHDSLYIGGVVGYIGSGVNLGSRYGNNRVYVDTDGDGVKDKQYYINDTRNLSYNVKVEDPYVADINNENNDNSVINIDVGNYRNNYVGGIVGYSLIDLIADFRGKIYQRVGFGNTAGAIVGFCEGNLTNCNVNLTGNTNLSINSGGIAGGCEGSVSNCTVNTNGYELAIAQGNTMNGLLYGGGIVGAASDRNHISTYKSTATNCVFIGNLNIGAFASYHSIFSIGNSTNCVFKGKITLATNSSNGALYQTYLNYSNATNCLIDATINGKVWEGFISSNSGFKISNGTATRCFVKGQESKIIDLVNGCSTFVSVKDSLVYNGSYFGYVYDALSDGTTFWEYDSGLGYPVIVSDGSKIARDTNLNITSVDNLNAINDLIITKAVSYKFSEKFTVVNDLSLSEFDGLGNSTYAFVGDGSTCIFTAGYGVKIYLGTNALFNNVKNITIDGMVFENDTDEDDNVIIMQNSPVEKATSCTITNCINNATINSANQYVGGIVGSANGCTITNCENFGEITSTISANGYAGGVVGNTLSTTTIESCVNNGKITNTQGLSRLGGIVGNSQSGTIIITNCENYGEIYNGGSAGGIIGGSYGGTISNCYVNCNILSRTNAGGIVGLTTGGTTTIVNCITEGIIDCLGADGYARVSGVVGRANVACTINNCISFAKIINQLNQATTSGIVNNVSTGNVVVNNSYFFGCILSNKYSVIASGSNIAINNCGYNMNNVDVNVIGSATVEDNGAQFIYVKNNPVWSSYAYIRQLFENETESMLNGTNTKLELQWNASNVFDIDFWGEVYNFTPSA